VVIAAWMSHKRGEEPHTRGRRTTWQAASDSMHSIFLQEGRGATHSGQKNHLAGSFRLNARHLPNSNVDEPHSGRGATHSGQKNHLAGSFRLNVQHLPNSNVDGARSYTLGTAEASASLQSILLTYNALKAGPTSSPHQATVQLCWSPRLLNKYCANVLVSTRLLTKYCANVLVSTTSTALLCWSPRLLNKYCANVLVSTRLLNKCCDSAVVLARLLLKYSAAVLVFP
jgi:hypothetical protein